MKAAVVTFPGSNCDQDMHRAVKLMDWKLVKLWHEDALAEKVDVIFVPGGFSYGDYLRCGALARFSRAMKSVAEHAKRGGIVMGVCNGFQILCEAGLLPGALTRNAGLSFRCQWVTLGVENTGVFSNACEVGTEIRIPIAHGEGRYHIDDDGLACLRDGNQIVYTYRYENPNGSVGNIAGIANAEGNVLGMMPHPERAMESLMGGTDGRHVFRSIENALSRVGA
ncbi:phosphoribosylformylglycinamidine synthase subunit PurQ [Candidatus Sumerlaeota bacterium]|nr:phosphoribosylformylglycinamidine synthase subunit PurQ [Candidatus Sumerlaeota bacterium]